MISGDCVADIRYNVIRFPVQSGIKIRDGARANLIGNTFEGPGRKSRPCSSAATPTWGRRLPTCAPPTTWRNPCRSPTSLRQNPPLPG
jgi:hypothetical protein